MNLLILFQLIFISLIPLIFGKSITITWSTPQGLSNGPSPGPESLEAILSHVQALLLADLVPNFPGIDKSLSIKLCPPQPYDPLVNNFVVQRIAAYSAIYDHDCINKVQGGMTLQKIISPSASASSPAWGFKPKPNPTNPQKPFPPPNDFYGSKGLTIPNFLIKLYKHFKSIPSNTEGNQIWIIDSKSLKNYFSAPILRSIYKKSQNSPAFQLLSQINAMRGGTLEEKDKDQLATVPLAVQDSLVLVLPNYSEWNGHKNNLPIKHLFFNPTWWSTRYIPRTKAQILKLCKYSIEKNRKSDQLVIIVHDPTAFNLDIVNQLTDIYGKKNLISATRVLPKTTTTLQLLQFIQKAAAVVLDSRDLLGQVGLLATGFPARVSQFQDYLPLTLTEIIIYSLLGVWFFAIMIVTIYYTDKFCNEKLHCHFKRLALFSILAITPIYVLIPSMWPKYLSMAIFSIFQSGYGIIIYAILTFYMVAIAVTSIILAVNYFKKQRASPSSTDDPQSESEASISDEESIQLIPKQ